MKLINLTEAIALVQGASFIGLDTLTEVKLTGGKKNVFQGRVQKQVTGSRVMVFTNKNINGYEAMVERRLIEEGKDPTSFELKPRLWGERIPNMPLVQHEKDGETQYYLEVIFLAAGTTEYLLDGLPIPKEEIVGLPERSEDPESQGGLDVDNKVIIRSYKIDSITKLRINGKEYR